MLATAAPTSRRSTDEHLGSHRFGVVEVQAYEVPQNAVLRTPSAAPLLVERRGALNFLYACVRKPYGRFRRIRLANASTAWDAGAAAAMKSSRRREDWDLLHRALCGPTLRQHGGSTVSPTAPLRKRRYEDAADSNRPGSVRVPLPRCRCAHTSSAARWLGDWQAPLRESNPHLLWPSHHGRTLRWR